MSTNVKFLVGSINTISFNGIDVFKTVVEVSIIPGIPSFIIVGLADKAINESKERIKSALLYCGYRIPNGKIVINLSPANKEKEGSHYDLPITLAILVAIGELRNEFHSYLILGEISLQGDIMPIKGVLPSVIFAKKNQYQVLCPYANYEEAILPGKDGIFAISSLKESVTILKRPDLYVLPVIKEQNTISEKRHSIFESIYGQEIGKRALMIAAAGKHNLMFIGPQGAGKSTLAMAIQELLPDLILEESLEVTSIYSLTGLLNTTHLIKRPPFRSPHSSSSLVSMVGGGSFPQPGEISLSHRGVLFLDELPEFLQPVIDSLRTPLEEGCVHLSRSKYKVTYPANFQFITSMNPCKCGKLLKGNCKCLKKNYMLKVSSPIQDRIGIKVILEEAKFERNNEFSIEYYRNKIINARQLQYQRFKSCNADISGKIIEDSCDNLLLNFIKKYIEDNSLSIRNYYHIISVARTIADLEGQDIINKTHVTEAMFFTNIIA